MCACFGMLRPYVVFWNASLWSLSGNAGDAAQPAPSLVNSEVNLSWFVFSTSSLRGVLGIFPGKAPVFCSLEDCCPR